MGWGMLNAEAYFTLRYVLNIDFEAINGGIFKIQCLWFLKNGDILLGRDRAVQTRYKTVAQIVCEV